MATFFSKVMALVGAQISEIFVGRYRDKKVEKALEKLAAINPIIIAVTGSYGKTSVKETLVQVLSEKFKVAKSLENYNTDIGIALSIMKELDEDTEIFVVEIGAYRRGEIEKIASRMQPDISIVTGLGTQHVALFGSRKNLILAKSELAQNTDAKGTVYINSDSEGFDIVTKKSKANVITYGTNKESDINLNDYSMYIKSTDIEHPINLLPVIAIAQDLGINNEIIEHSLSNLKRVPNRLEVVENSDGAKILLDTYSSNKAGFTTAVNRLGKIDAEIKVVITKGIKELGEYAPKIYKQLVEEFPKDYYYLTTDEMLYKELMEENVENTIKASNERELYKEFKKLVNDGVRSYSVLLEGRFSSTFIERFK
jgi:UDP-N-acetylmuramyl pentapeptide synthase